MSPGNGDALAAAVGRVVEAVRELRNLDLLEKSKP